MATAVLNSEARASNGPAAPPSTALQPVPGAALAASDPAANSDEDALTNSAAALLPVEVEVGVPVREFRVRHLLALVPGQVIESQWSHVEDVPLGAGKVQLAWSEFEVLDAKMAVRLTRLA
ncbi:MAG: FliM/FliN family flagellar motor C-terminal domain-containing protein [Acidobacteriota bacterium]